MCKPVLRTLFVQWSQNPHWLIFKHCALHWWGRLNSSAIQNQRWKVKVTMTKSVLGDVVVFHLDFVWLFNPGISLKINCNELICIYHFITFLCRRQSISAYRDHFVRHLSVRPSVCPSMCLSGSHSSLVVTHSYVSEATHAFLGMLPLFDGLCLFVCLFVVLRHSLWYFTHMCDVT